MGYTVDFSDFDNQNVSFSYYTTDSIDLVLYLKDINGKISNGNKIKISLTRNKWPYVGAASWTSLTFNWYGDINASASTICMIDSTSSEWWGRPNIGYRQAQENLDSSRIISLIISAYSKENNQLSKEIKFKDIRFGGGYNPFQCHIGLKVFEKNHSLVKNDTIQLVGFEKITDLKLYDILGKQYPINYSPTISLQHLQYGIYIVRFKDNGKVNQIIVKKE